MSTSGGGLTVDLTDPATEDVFNRTQYVCHLEYPFQASSASELGIMSTDQLEYLYSYFTSRLVPCLKLMGYRVGNPPSHDSFIFSAPNLAWTPYQAMSPQVTTAEIWGRVDARCPPPTVGVFYREGLAN